MAANNQGNKPSSTKNKAIPINKANDETNIFYLLPILIIVAILPLVMRLHIFNANLSDQSWFSKNDEYGDFFLYYKQQLFLILSAFMAVIAIYRSYVTRKSIHYPRTLMPIAIYALLALLSSLLSENKAFSFSGIYEQFESIFVLLGYCLTVYYVFLIVKTEKDIKYIIGALLIGAIILSLLGLTQIAGHDLFTTARGWRLITPRSFWDAKDLFTFNFGSQVYLTLYNPNYVGTYASLVLPPLLISGVVAKRLWLKLTFLLSAAAIIVSLIGSKSDTGIISVLFGAILAVIVFRNYLIKYLYVTIPTIVIIIGALLFFNYKYDNLFVNQLQKVTNLQKSTPALSEIQTNDTNLSIRYNNSLLQINFLVSEDEVCTFNVYDGDLLPINYTQDITTNSIILQDQRFPGFTLTPVRNEDNTLAFSVTIDGYLWYFTNQVMDNTYYYINNYGKYDKMITAPSSLFTGYENFATRRGYIWSRTIPLLKDNIVLGTGADTFSFVFPHQDYVNGYNFGFNQQLITKPHNLYLQIGVQTGVLSLIAFLIFYTLYFVSSLKLYGKGICNTYCSYIGTSIMISSACYMIGGLANDSCIAVAPLFWVFMGLGITVNRFGTLERKQM
ncbi:MAG: hypothetical protein K0R46_856 [Herbinix sp.]|nr:hypothetical protein [Herbinix sp.]